MGIFVHCRHAAFAAAVFAAMAAGQASHAITVGMVDTFSNGTNLGWSGSPMTNVADAGPGGIGDHAAQVNSSGLRIVAYSQKIPGTGGAPDDLRWTGDYTASGITKIALDVRHSNATPLFLRIGIGANGFGTSGGQNGLGDTYVTNYGLGVPGDGQWHTLEFPVEAANFAPSSGNTSSTPNPAAALADVTHFRFIHNPAERDFRGAEANLPFFMDNVRAIGVPEPKCLVMLALGTTLVAGRRARRP